MSFTYNPIVFRTRTIFPDHDFLKVKPREDFNYEYSTFTHDWMCSCMQHLHRYIWLYLF